MEDIFILKSFGDKVSPPFGSVSGKICPSGVENTKCFIKLAKNKKMVFLATLSPKHFLLPVKEKMNTLS